MELTWEEIKEIADHLDGIIGDNFHNAICNIINEREFGDSKYMEVSDQDVRRIKDELKRIL